jgi:hypothetical protein
VLIMSMSLISPSAHEGVQNGRSRFLIVRDTLDCADTCSNLYGPVQLTNDEG